MDIDTLIERQEVLVENQKQLLSAMVSTLDLMKAEKLRQEIDQEIAFDEPNKTVEQEEDPRVQKHKIIALKNEIGRKMVIPRKTWKKLRVFTDHTMNLLMKSRQISLQKVSQVMDLTMNYELKMYVRFAIRTYHILTTNMKSSANRSHVLRSIH